MSEGPRSRGAMMVRAVSLAFAFSLGTAQAAGAYDVVVLQSFDNPVYAKAIEGFKETCGGSVTTYTLDKNKKIEQRDFDAIKSKKPAAILAMGPSALVEILGKKPPMPVIFTAVTEKPTNLTPAAGILMNVPMEKQLDTLLKIAPAVKRIGVVYNPAKTQYYVDDLMKAAKAKSLTVVAKVATTGPDAVKELNAMVGSVDAYVLAPDTSIHTDPLEKAALTISIKNKIPVVGFKKSQCEAGTLFSSEMDPLEMGKQAGEVTRDLLDGKKPSPAYTPIKKFKLLLNPKVADQLNLRIPVEVATGASLCTEVE